MIYIRSSLFLLGQLLAVVIYAPVAFAAYPLNPTTRSMIIGYWAYFVVWWLKVTCGLRHELRGAENIPRSPCVILSKHQSAWETIAFQTIFPPQAWVLKRELLRIPVFGWALAMTQPIAIDRREGVHALHSVAEQGVDRLRNGRFVVVFPEGTRVAPGERGRYNPGGAMLAVRAGVGVLPVAHNAGEFWPRHGFLKRPGVIQVVVGPMIDVEGKRAKKVSREAEQWIEAAMQDLAARGSQPDPTVGATG
jgi:1-acyl-sn-glycerol-3-phosphate acyltransferase